MSSDARPVPVRGRDGLTAADRAIVRTVALFNGAFGALGLIHGAGYVVGALAAAGPDDPGLPLTTVGALGAARAAASLALLVSAPLAWRRRAPGRVLSALPAVVLVAVNLGEPTLLHGHGAGWGPAVFGCIYPALLLFVLAGARGRARFVAPADAGTGGPS